jgi:P27 family predicted phage terminase small subunit
MRLCKNDPPNSPDGDPMLNDSRTSRFAAAPQHLAAEEAKLWDQLVRTYRFDDPASLELLTQACEARGRARQAREMVQNEGSTYKDDRGNLKAHPMIAVERSAEASFLSAFRLLRLDLAGGSKS